MLTYGNEAWTLTEETQAKLNGCNARCLSHITGLSAHTEASARTRTYDLVGAIRQRRYRWLVRILRISNNRLIKEAVKVQFYMRLPVNIFMDAPQDLSFDQLVERAKDRKLWRQGVPPLKQKSCLAVKKEQSAFEKWYEQQQRALDHELALKETHFKIQNNL